MRIFCAAAFLLALVAPAAPLTAEDYAHFPTYEANDWVITDSGEERCQADFSLDGNTVLSFMGPYFPEPDEAASGSIIHLADESHYVLPKGDRHGEFPVELVAGTARFAVSGFATDLGGSLIVNSGNIPTVIDLLAALPDSVILTAMVEGKQVYAIELAGNHSAAGALRDCTAFITAQKRPGTKNGPRLGPPSPPKMIEPPPISLPDRAPNRRSTHRPWLRPKQGRLTRCRFPDHANNRERPPGRRCAVSVA